MANQAEEKECCPKSDPAPWHEKTHVWSDKVFDGPYSKVPAYLKEFYSYIDSVGKKAKKIYFYFTTCPKCARKYGHNYIVAFAEV
jgi:hypothetical protein